MATSSEKKNEAAVLQVSSSQHVTESGANTMQTTVANVQNLEMKHKGCESHVIWHVLTTRLYVLAVGVN